MAITIGNIGSASWTVSSTDITPTLPSHTEGNLLLGFAMRRSSSAQTPTLTASAGWTKLHEFNGRTMVLWGKKAGVSESNPTFSHTNNDASNPWGAFVMEVVGADADNLGTIVHASTAGTSTGSVSAHTFNGMTITNDGCLLLDFGQIIIDGRTITATSSPAYTQAIQSESALGNSINMFVQYRIQTTAANTSSHTATWTGGNSQSNEFSVALLPASASTGIVPITRNYHNLMS